MSTSRGIGEAPVKVKEVITRDLRNEPQPTVRVYEDAQLRTDFAEYVLTEALGREFDKVLERVVESAAPAAPVTNKVGVWVSGFYGSGKSHFAKLVGHTLANTQISGRNAREYMADLLRAGTPSHDRMRELLQEAANYPLSAMVVPFDIQTDKLTLDIHGPPGDDFNAWVESLKQRGLM